MRIGELARRTGVAPRMLRYYEAQELLTPRRRSNGYREYDLADVDRVEMIRDLSASGVPTRFIKIVIERQVGEVAWTSRCDEILAGMVTDQIADLDAKIRCLSASRAALAQLLEESGTQASVAAG
ncbi:MerR family transcriptional regulator [Gordonia sp. CPCC 206044]|uniref:MerR family transcriptional regulator n=1 Tax=Gordonia sp. CPCC 206044 TaxID=3140793 RepID=UPI003AF34CC3